MTEEENSPEKDPDTVVVPLDDEESLEKKTLIEEEDRERLKNSPFGDLSDVSHMAGPADPKRVEPGKRPVEEKPTEGRLTREDNPNPANPARDLRERADRIREEAEALRAELDSGAGGGTPRRTGAGEEDVKERFEEINPQARLKRLKRFFEGEAVPYPTERLLSSFRKQLVAMKRDYNDEAYGKAMGRIDAVGSILSDIETFYES